MKKQIITFFSAIGMLAIVAGLFLYLEISKIDGEIISLKFMCNHMAKEIVCLLSFVFLLALVIFLYQLGRWVWYADRTNRISHHVKLLGSIMFMLWTIGWILFIQAFLCYDRCHQYVNAEILLRSAIDSLNMFMLNIDNNLLDQIKNQSQLKGAIFFVSILSFSCTIGLLLNLVSARLRAYIKLCFTKVKKNSPHMYLFFGLNEQTEILANSVKTNDPKSVRIVVEQNNRNNDEKDGWGHVVSMITHRRESFSKIRNMGVQLSLASTDLSEIDIKQKDVFGEANLEIIKERICWMSKIRNTEEKKLHIFFLSDNEEKNILSTALIREDKTIRDVSSKGIQVVIYCHARYDSVNRVIEESNPLKNVEVRIIDSSRLSIELLKRSDKNHPVKFVEIDSVDNPGTVKSAFNSLVVGFGETGRDAVKFLYEFGAFMSNDSNNDKVKRSDFHCYIVDKDMNSKEGAFSNSATEATKAENSDGSKLLQFIHSDTASTDFYHLLQQIASSLNYVVIAMEEDIENMTLAIKILKYAMANGTDMKHFRVLVRIRNNSHIEHFRKITNHYNISTGYNCMEVFGAYNEIFSYSFVVEDQFKKDAESFYNRYQEVMQENEPALQSGSWEERRNQLLGFCKKVVVELPVGVAMQRYNENKPVNEKMSQTGVYMGFEYVAQERTLYPQYKDLRKLRRQTEQDMSNAWHKLTKKELLEEYINQNYSFSKLYKDIQQLPNPQKGQEYRHKYDQLQGKLGTLILNLAITEHLRWNASHEMLGYKMGERTDELLQIHNCLVGWEKLDDVSKQSCEKAIKSTQEGVCWEFEFSEQIKKEHPNYKEKIKAYVLYLPDYKKYDFAVVETTIALLKNDIEKQHEQK